MPSEPTIGVIVPVHNQENYLQRCLFSILPQLGPQDELIVVDDGSTPPINTKIFQFTKRIQWFRNPKATGVSAARNFAVRNCNADWVKFLDADDVLCPFALTFLRQTITQDPKGLYLVSGNCFRVFNGEFHDYIGGTSANLKRIKTNNPTLPSAAIVKRSAFNKVGMFDERMDFNEDWDLWLRLHHKFGDAGFIYTDYPVCYYWIDEIERENKNRTKKVGKLTVREHLQRKYGAVAKE